MSVMDWLQSKGCREGKESWRYKLSKSQGGFVNPNPPPLHGNEEGKNKVLMSNITTADIVLSEDNIRALFQKRFSYEYLLTFSDHYLCQLMDFKDLKLERDLQEFFNKYSTSRMQYYFVKEYAPNSNRPHYHGIISFSEIVFKQMARAKETFNKNYFHTFGYTQWARINSFTETYSPTEQNLHQKRNIGDYHKYYEYIHKGIQGIPL